MSFKKWWQMRWQPKRKKTPIQPKDRPQKVLLTTLGDILEFQFINLREEEPGYFVWRKDDKENGMDEIIAVINDGDLELFLNKKKKENTVMSVTIIYHDYYLFLTDKTSKAN